MNYEGNISSIPLGLGGLYTDGPSSRIPASKLEYCENIIVKDGIIEKDFGSKRWNPNAVLPGGLLAFQDWWPDTITQRMIAVCDNGAVYKFKDDGEHYSVISASGLAPTQLQVSEYYKLVECGAEDQGRDRKMILFSSSNPPQVIAADGNLRTNISSPPADWTGLNQPFFGIVHNNRLVAFGNDTSTIHLSSASDHEDFTSSPLFFSVYPGEGERLINAVKYKDRLFLFKYPRGVYYLDDDDPNTANWSIKKFTGFFGAVSPFSALELFNDILIGDETGGLISMSATDKFGDIESADLFENFKIKRILRERLSLDGRYSRRFLYDREARILYVSYQGKTDSEINRILKLDYSTGSPEITYITKDVLTCFGTRKDLSNIERPYYGSDDGYIYRIGDINRYVHDTGYSGIFDTPHFDMGQSGTQYQEQMKDFNFVEFVYIPTGNFNLEVEYFIDGRYINTFNVNLKGLSTLGTIKTGQRFSPNAGFSTMIKVGGQGRRIKFRCKNSSAGENFKIAGINIYWKPLGNYTSVRK